MDYEGISHVDCAKIMDISRTTVSEIYESAKKKMADFLINGKGLLIDGGVYSYCDGSAYPYCQKKCDKIQTYVNQISKGENVMRIAVTFENEMVFQHFGHTEQFKIYDVDENKVRSSSILDTNESGHGALAGFLQANKVDVLICGGIGRGAQNALAQVGIKLYGGVSGNADKAVEEFLFGNLEYNSEVKCNHHENDEQHECSDHGCGSHKCGH